MLFRSVWTCSCITSHTSDRACLALQAAQLAAVRVTYIIPLNSRLVYYHIQYHIVCFQVYCIQPFETYLCWSSGELHGDMTQAARLDSLERFRKGELAFLLATDVAARGLDIIGVQVVVNYDAPRTFETYLHRIGRTARAGAQGQAVTLIEDGDRVLLKDVVKKGKVQLKQRLVPQQVRVISSVRVSVSAYNR